MLCTVHISHSVYSKIHLNFWNWMDGFIYLFIFIFCLFFPLSLSFPFEVGQRFLQAKPGKFCSASRWWLCTLICACDENWYCSMVNYFDVLMFWKRFCLHLFTNFIVNTLSPVNFSKMGKQRMVLQGKFFDIVSLLAKVFIRILLPPATLGPTAGMLAILYSFV